jgi:hypothetical protein
MARATQIKTAKTATVTEAQPRISVGTSFDTKNDAFFAGRLQPADGRYANQDELLKMLPTPAEGHHWGLKVFVRETKNGRTVLDVILQQEEDYQPEA